MGFIILDGKGSGQSAAISPSGNRLNVSSRADERIYYISRDNGDSYSVTSIDASPSGGEYNFYFKNTSTTQKFYVKHIIVGAADLAIFKVAVVTGTAAGTELTPVNLNLTSGRTASCDCRGNGAITGLTESSVIDIRSVEADATEGFDFHDALILGQGDAIAVEFDTGSASAIHISMLGFYDLE